MSFPFVILFLCFSVLLALRLPRLGKRELILVLFIRLFDFCLFGVVCFSSSWCLGRAAVCDCGTPWTFSLTFFCIRIKTQISINNRIMKTCLYNLDTPPPLKPHFYIVKLGFTGVYIIFAQKHRLWVLVRTSSTRLSMFWAEVWKYQFFIWTFLVSEYEIFYIFE